MPEDLTTSPPRSISNRTAEFVRGTVRALSLSRIQSLVAILAGIATVSGAAISLAQVGRPGRTGTLVAIVRTTGPSQSARDATVEVLTTQNALVATLTPDANGRATRDLREGVYLVRVSHPRYAANVHRIEVQAGETIEVKTTLRANASVSIDRGVNKGVSALRRALGF